MGCNLKVRITCSIAEQTLNYHYQEREKVLYMLTGLYKSVYMCGNVCRKTPEWGVFQAEVSICILVWIEEKACLIWVNEKKSVWFTYKAWIRGDTAGERVMYGALELYPKTRRTHWSILSKEIARSHLCFRKPTLLLWGERTELHLTPPGQ